MGKGNAMGKRGYARKRDDNEPGIIAALELAGASVTVLDKPVDALVGYHGIDHQMEIKNGNQPPSWQRITRDQKNHIATWQGRPVAVVNTMDQALEVIGVPAIERAVILKALADQYDEAGVPF